MLSYWHQDDHDDDPRIENAVVAECVHALMRDGWDFKDLGELEAEFSWALDLDDWRGQLRRQQSYDARAEWWAREHEHNRQLAAVRRQQKLFIYRKAVCQHCGEAVYAEGELEEFNRLPSRQRARCWNCQAERNAASMRASYRRRVRSNGLAQMQHLINEAEEYEVATP